MAGVVTKHYVEQGELVTSGGNTFSSGTPVLQIADLSRMLVRMTVNEVDVHRVQAGLPVEITIDGARRVAPAALGSSNASGAPGGEAQASSSPGGGGVVRFAVEVMVEHPDPRLK